MATQLSILLCMLLHLFHEILEGGRETEKGERRLREGGREGGRERERPFTNQAAHHLYKCYIAADIKSPHPSMYTVHISSVE